MYVPFSYFSKGFYRMDDIIAIALMVHLYFFCDDDCHQDKNQALARINIIIFVRIVQSH